MAAPIEALVPMRIGVDEVVWAPLLLDDGTAKTSYKKVEREGKQLPYIIPLPGVMVLNINPNSSIETAYYDDGPGEAATTVGNVEVTFNKSALTADEMNILLGKKVNKYGMVFSSKQDIAPWGALGFRTLRSDGTYRYVWLLKGKFSDPAENNETKGETVNFQNTELVGRFVKLNWEFQVSPYDSADTRSVKPWKVETEGYASGGQILDTSWYGDVVLPDTKFRPLLNSSQKYVVVQRKDVQEVIIYSVTETGGKVSASLVDGTITIAKESVTGFQQYVNGGWINSNAEPAADITIENDAFTTIYNTTQVEVKQGSAVVRTMDIRPIPYI